LNTIGLIKSANVLSFIADYLSVSVSQLIYQLGLLQRISGLDRQEQRHNK